MHVDVYADESRTFGQKDVQNEILVTGVIALRHEWTAFCADWQRVLNQYRLPYFHFREWSDASAVARKKRAPNSMFHNNPFGHLSAPELDNLLEDLVPVACRGDKVHCGANRTHVASGPTKDDLSKLMADFFSDYVRAINRYKPPWKRNPVSFIFDRSDRADWICAVDQQHQKFQQNRKKGSLAFHDKKEHLPLQAADLFAYHSRQVFAKKISGDDAYDCWPLVDELMMKHWSARLRRK